jgi:hypothetical protein
MQRLPYTLDDLAVIFLTRKSKANASDLADLFDRKPSSIDWMWRTFEEGGSIGPRPSRRLTEQVQLVAARLGWDAFMSCATVAEALDRVHPSAQGAA